MLHLSPKNLGLKLLRRYLWFITLFTSIPALAQIQKGQFHLAGEFQTYTNLQKNFYINNSFQISAGFMVSPKWSVGLGIPFQFNPGNHFRYIVPGIAPFVRHYFDLKSNFFLVLHAQLGATFTHSTYFKSADFSARFSPAINYFISPRFGVEASFAEVSQSFHSQTINDSSVQWSESKFWFSLRPRFSLRYYFIKKRGDAIATNY